MVLLSERAASAEDLVLRRFVGRYRHVPGTRMARTAAPTVDNGAPFVVDGSTPFHYWWQAHLLDAIVDGGLRRLRTGDVVGARRSATLGHRLLATIRLRNRGTFANHFFDDMAWLALAVDRLATLDARVGLPLRRRSLGPARSALARQLLLARDTAGGVVWNKDRDFLNAPTAGPVALHLARTGHTREARVVVEWLMDHLLERDRGLVLDGVRRNGAVEEAAYTYNQGTTVAALLELGEPHDIERAGALVHAVDVHMTHVYGGARVLVTHGGGDGGLFTGILVRYLSLVALHPGMGANVSDVAAGLVLATGDALWEGRDPATGLFPAAAGMASQPPAGTRAELSTQLQAWLVMEAAGRLGA